MRHAVRRQRKHLGTQERGQHPLVVLTRQRRSLRIVHPRAEAAPPEEEHLPVLDGDLDGFVEADRAFHTVLVAAAGNPIVLSLYESLRDRQQRMGVTALWREPRRLGEILDEHRALTEAVAAGDVARTLELLDAHLYRTLVLLREG